MHYLMFRKTKRPFSKPASSGKTSEEQNGAKISSLGKFLRPRDQLSWQMKQEKCNLIENITFMKRKGFTLIELVIATVILTVMVVSISGAFNIGIKAWRRGNEGQDFQKVRIALLKIQKELKSSFFFSKAGFRGASSEVVFPLSILEENTEKIYIITYRMDENKDTGARNLVREKRLFTENPQDEKEAIKEPVFPVRLIAFKYAYKLEDGSNGFEWQDSWPETQNNIPSAVKISFQLDNSDEIYNKTIFIPQGAPGTR